MKKTGAVFYALILIFISTYTLLAIPKNELYQVAITCNISFCSESDYASTILRFKIRSKDSIISEARVGNDGNFKISINCGKGQYELCASHPDCVPIRIPIYIDSNFSTNVAIRLNHYSTQDTTVYFYYGTSQFPLDRTAIPIKGADNVWRAKVKAQSNEIFYQVIGDEFSRRTHCPSRYDRIIPDSEGDMIGVIATNNKDSVILEYMYKPYKACQITNSVKFSNITLENRNQVCNRVQLLMNELQNLRNQNLIPKWIEQSHFALGIFDSALTKEKDSYLTAFFLKSYAEVAVIGWYTKQPKYKPEILERIIEHCQSYLDVWTVDLDRPFAFPTFACIYENDTAITKHLEQILECNTISDEIKSQILSGLDEIYSYKTQDSLLNYIRQILFRSYVGTSGYDKVSKLIEDNSIFVGKQVIDIKTIDNKGNFHTVSHNDYSGKFLLLDFWATWCKPCIGEMPNLIKARNLFDTSRLQIIGISRDTDLNKLKLFLQKKNLPWNNYMISPDIQESIIKFYSAEAIPRTILVSPQGIVIAAGNKLRGEQLIETLNTLIK